MPSLRRETEQRRLVDVVVDLKNYLQFHFTELQAEVKTTMTSTTGNQSAAAAATRQIELLRNDANNYHM